VFVDGFNTTSTIDTFSNDSSLPLCYPVQFPPFVEAPPDQAATDHHSITLVYTGSSPNAPNGSSSEIQFESFAIPDFQSPPASSSGFGLRDGGTALLTTIILIIVTFSMS
jgi:hypothetical protein